MNQTGEYIYLLINVDETEVTPGRDDDLRALIELIVVETIQIGGTGEILAEGNLLIGVIFLPGRGE
jgi:hypothetical protein